MFDIARGIISGREFLADHLVNNDKNPDMARLSLYDALLRAALYSSE